ncbi:DEAD/DEAH box helicase [Rhodoferax mekongensis]|uniref:DEAD/DEAH box helicase n=1 Tax=Rhodoferax mekongensis TaxID=3068341 RepID=UPI0028BE6643|nr:DEAD/DEAH box helicase [Rhodoferax sp. TBRC 17199]MDT7513621.1 DEAD/DEAH box helicase [Rhodoferax sp. TBRC 17199]
MSRLEDQRVEIANRVHEELGKENALTASQARLFVRCLQSAWKVPTIQWGETESGQQLADANRLLHVAGIFRQVEGPESIKAFECYRRCGELLEWLSRADDGVKALAPVELLAAGAYQLGGLPAMAAGLIRQVDQLEPGERLIGAFLSGDFDMVIAHVAAFWSENPQLITRDSGSTILKEATEDRVDWYIAVSVIRTLGLFADALRRGNSSRLSLAMQKLRGIERLVVRTGSEELSILLYLLCATGEGYIASSVHNPARALSSMNQNLADRLRIFAREQFSRSRGVLWPSQQRGLKKLMESSSFALCTPTGSGKTLVANFALIKELLLPSIDGVAPLGLYLVPSRALAGEVEGKLTSELGRDFTITGLYGGADWGITDYWLNSDKPSVLIATVEKADALMRYAGPMLLARLQLLIVDEAHQVVADTGQRGLDSFAEHSSRSLRLESFVSRLLSIRPDVARIALTAVAGGAAHPVARWMEGTPNAVPIGLRYRSTRQLVGALEVSPQSAGQIVLDHLNGQPLFVRGRQDPVYIRLKSPVMPRLPAAVRNSLNHVNQLSVLWTALQLVEGNRRILISVAQRPEQTMRWYAEALTLPSWEGLGRPQISSDPASQALFSEARATCIDYCGQDSHEVSLLDRGIATSHGQMPQRLRRLMTLLIDRRICAITVATATLTEGVNLPFDLIFVTALQRTSFDSTLKRQVSSELPTAEFRNLAGRAGRPGSADGMEGMILVALPMQPSATAPTTIRTQRRQIKDLHQNYENLLGRLLAEERVADDVPSPLGLLLKTLNQLATEVLGHRDQDSFLVWLEDALPDAISENAGRCDDAQPARLADTVDELDSILLNSIEELRGIENAELSGAQAESLLAQVWNRTFTAVASVNEAWMESAFVRRGRALIEKIYPDAAERRRLYQYGFTPVVGRRFAAIASQLRVEIAAASSYGLSTEPARLEHFKRLGLLLLTDRGFGFRIRQTEQDKALLENWVAVLSWWMNVEGSQNPSPNDLRAWQRFVSDNLDFRLGVALGAVAAQAWSQGSTDPLSTPSLSTWKQTTGLPWFGFWAKELLRWGTLDPFVAFAMAQGLADTRLAASSRRADFVAWLHTEIETPDSEDYIDPRRYLSWQKTLTNRQRVERIELAHQAELSETSGKLGRYEVVPLIGPNGVDWIDASGFRLAKSDRGRLTQVQDQRSDYVLKIDAGIASVSKVFAPR